MSQNKEANQFLSRIAALPTGPISLDEVLQPSLHDEAELRKLFATDKGNVRVRDIHVGLVDVFAAPSDIRTTRARVIKDDADLDAQHVLALPSSLRREEGSPAMVDNLEAFKKNWDIFTESSLSQLADWSNVIAAGGSVQASLMPLPKAARSSKRAMRKYFHDKAFPSSDVDLFLYGLTVDEAERKIITIYETVRDSVPWDVTCVRTKHTVSIHSQYPYRNIQIVLRLYSSPAEVLAGFDVDAPCCAYDGDRVWANPRAIVSMMRQSNTVDMTRRSPSYEVRLAKYSSRGFEVYVPGLTRDEIDPTIYERAIGRVPGLARLLAIEKLATPEASRQYQFRRSSLRGRPFIPRSSYNRRQRKYKGDLKAAEVFSGLEMSDYDVVNLHIPYGPGWDARRIERHIYKSDFGANSPYNPKNKNRRLHRHSAFFGTVQECIEDCCKLCPEPENEEEHNLQDEEDKSYVRGRIAFIEEDPGRQSISGSFNPIDEGEWCDAAYVQATARFCSAICKNDVLAVKQMIEDGEEPNRRDQVGRTPLHVAILSDSVEVGCVLIDAGARMTARLVGGRTSLHLAAQMGQVLLVKKMLERSAYNKEKAEEKRKMEAAAGGETDGVRMSSEDDWSSEESDEQKPHRKPPAYTKKDEPEIDPDTLEDNEDEPDVLDISIRDWDFGLTPLAYAILSGSFGAVDALLTAGADPSFVSYAKNVNPLHPLALTIYTQDEERAAKIAERLIAAQAISSTADDNLFTIFHRIVAAGKTKIVASLLSHDANAKKVLNTIKAGDYATLSLLLAHGAKLSYSPGDVSRAEEKWKTKYYLNPVPEYRARIHLPIETAIGQYDEVISLLASLGADVDVPIMSSNSAHTQSLSLLHWTSKAISFLESKSKIAPEPIEAPKNLPDSPAGDTWSQYRAYVAEVLSHHKDEDRGYVNSQGLQRGLQYRFGNVLERKYAPATKEYLTFAESVLRAHGATLPEGALISKEPATGGIGTQTPTISQGSGYKRYGEPMTAPVHLKVFYDELYEACWNGDNASIQELCLPKQVAEGKEPIQIVVQTTTATAPYHYLGWTPLTVAVHRRHWNTARLVLAIATAQYQPRDTQIDPITDAISAHLADYSEQTPIDFTDIAARPSPVRTEIHPATMLQLSADHLQDGHRDVSCSPLEKAIIENDIEAFVRTLDLCEFVAMEITPDSAAFNLAVTLDRPEILDEFIRRSGIGIPIPFDAEVSEKPVYLGLKVGGTRRVGIRDHNLAKRKTLMYKYELLRSAIQSGATNVIDYLTGPRPIAACRHYAETHDDEIARYLNSIDDLDAAFPELLGWTSDGLNESPLLCAVIANRLDVLKQMFALKPSLMEESLHLRVKLVGFNALLTAAYYCSGTEIVDFLLEKGCDPSERDARGWDIYHLACVSLNNNRVKMVEHLLKTLPEELTHELMAQTSKDASNTPLMLAVKRRNAETLRTILKFGIDPAVLLLRDADGSTPLHVAVREEDTILAEILLEYGPTQLLYVENCVGQTPLDIASLRSLPRAVPGIPQPAQLPTNVEGHLRYPQKPPPCFLEKQKRDPKLRATLDTLLADGCIAPDSKLATELLAFSGRMERRLAEGTAQMKAEEKQADKGELVHLADIQRSVKRDLAEQSARTFVQHFQIPRGPDGENKENNLEDLHITALSSRSMFMGGYEHPRSVYLYGGDMF
ncbi:hypothetical protein EI94DRAFT_1780506 [Lactarius quietus]|nr:hypothetical protein EI94DRAFT_1780506 [Lactarius quietus]